MSRRTQPALAAEGLNTCSGRKASSIRTARHDRHRGSVTCDRMRNPACASCRNASVRSATAREPTSQTSEVKHLQHAKPLEADEDEIDGNDEIEEARHQQDQDACDQCHDGLDMRCRDDH